MSNQRSLVIRFFILFQIIICTCYVIKQKIAVSQEVDGYKMQTRVSIYIFSGPKQAHGMGRQVIEFEMAHHD